MSVRSRSLVARLICIALVGLLVTAVGCARGETYPKKPVTFIVPFAPGGPSDVNARTIAEYAKKYFPQGIVVQNVPGGSATVGTHQMITSPPDGYTWLYGGTAELASALHIVKPPYTVDDYDLVLKIGNMPTVLLVKADSPWKTLGDFIAYAREHPGEVKVGTPGEASVNRLVGELLCDAAGVRVVMVPFAGNAAVIPAILGGHVQAGLVNTPDAAAHAKEGGQLRGLAVFSRQTVAAISHIATAKEQGFEVTGTVSHYLAIPKGVAPSVVDYIHESIRKVLEDSAYVEAANKFAFQVEYKDGREARKELNGWYQTARTLYERLGMLKK